MSKTDSKPTVSYARKRKKKSAHLLAESTRRVAVVHEQGGGYQAHSELRKVDSLFSGAMGLDLGLTEGGLQIAVSQDFDPWCVETMRQNTTHPVVAGDIRKLVAQDPSCGFLLGPANIKPGEVFAVVGGPPCQAFSTAGKRRGEQDQRGSLYAQFIHVVEQLRPRFFVMENVKGLLSMLSDPDDEASEPLLRAFPSIM